MSEAVSQWRQVLGPAPTVTCPCGFDVPLRFMHKCLYCSTYLCYDCAQIHFGRTYDCYRESKAARARCETDLFEGRI
jgi:hypothetical protein